MPKLDTNSKWFNKSAYTLMTLITLGGTFASASNAFALQENKTSDDSAVQVKSKPGTLTTANSRVKDQNVIRLTNVNKPVKTVKTVDSITKAGDETVKDNVNTKDLTKAQGQAYQILSLQSQNYQDDGLKQVQSAYNDSLGLWNNSKTTQADVDASVAKLANALNTLQETDEADYTELQSTLQNISTILDGTNASHYKSDSKKDLQSVYKQAMKLNSKDTATQTDLDNAVKALNQSTKGLKPESEKLDSNNLTKAVKNANQVMQNGDKYTAKSLAQLESVLKQANKVLSDASTSQLSIDTMTTKLNQSIESVTPKADLTNLNSAIKLANKAISNKDGYTSSSISGVRSALSVAKGLIDDENVSQNDVNTATTNLSNSLKALKAVNKPKSDTKQDSSKDTNKKSDNKEEKQDTEKVLPGESLGARKDLEGAVGDAEGLLKNDADYYSESSLAKLQKAVDKAKKLLTDKNASDSSLEKALEEVENANDALVIKPSNPDDDKGDGVEEAQNNPDQNGGESSETGDTGEDTDQTGDTNGDTDESGWGEDTDTEQEGTPGNIVNGQTGNGINSPSGKNGNDIIAGSNSDTNSKKNKKILGILPQTGQQRTPKMIIAGLIILMTTGVYAFWDKLSKRFNL